MTTWEEQFRRRPDRQPLRELIDRGRCAERANESNEIGRTEMPVRFAICSWWCMATLLILLLTAPDAIAQAAPFTRGERVREVVVTPANGPKRLGMVVQVVAVPGDRVAVDDNRLLINGQAVEGFSSSLVVMIARSKRVPEKIADGQYLVMGEYAVTGGDVVRKWGMYSAEQLEPAVLGSGQ